LIFKQKTNELIDLFEESLEEVDDALTLANAINSHQLGKHKKAQAF